MNNEMLIKARNAKSAEEVLSLAHEIGLEDFTEENAKQYFDMIHKSGEISDDELDGAAGGCKKGGRRVVTIGLECAGYKPPRNDHFWRCKKCKQNDEICKCHAQVDLETNNPFQYNRKNRCGTCGWCTYEGGMWYCNNPKANEL